MGDVAMTTGQQRGCIALAKQMDRIKTFPGGSALLVDLLLAMAARAGLTLVDKTEWDRLTAT